MKENISHRNNNCAAKKEESTTKKSKFFDEQVSDMNFSSHCILLGYFVMILINF